MNVFIYCASLPSKDILIQENLSPIYFFGLFFKAENLKVCELKVLHLCG